MSEIPMYPDQCEHGASRPDVCGHCRLAALQARHDIVVKREAELHYGIRRDANILDHKLTEHEAHLTALARVGRLHAIEEAARRLSACDVGTPRATEAWILLVDALAGL